MKFPGNIGEIFGQVQQLQSKVAELQTELEKKEIEASSGGGMVTVRINGALKVLSVQIDKTVVDPADVEMLQDLVGAAMNEALRKAKDMLKEEMGALTGGLPIPGLS